MVGGVSRTAGDRGRAGHVVVGEQIKFGGVQQGERPGPTYGCVLVGAGRRGSVAETGEMMVSCG